MERIVEAGATALIIALVVGAFATAGVIDMPAAIAMLFLAWVIGSVAIGISDYFRSSARRWPIAGMVSASVTLGILLLGVGWYINLHRPNHAETASGQDTAASPPIASTPPTEQSKPHRGAKIGGARLVFTAELGNLEAIIYQSSHITNILVEKSKKSITLFPSIVQFMFDSGIGPFDIDIRNVSHTDSGPLYGIFHFVEYANNDNFFEVGFDPTEFNVLNFGHSDIEIEFTFYKK